MYSAEISRRNPTCFVFVLDQSGSMADPFSGAPGMSKAVFLSDVVNRTLHDLVIRSTAQDEILNRYEIAVIGYGSDVRPAFAGALAGRELVTIDELGRNPSRLESRTRKEPDGAGGLVERTVRFPIWMDPVAGGGTPMVRALWTARQLLERWVAQHPDAFPPTVIHCTDGESTDGDPRPEATALSQLATSDGQALLFNCYISSRQGQPVQFPGDGVDLGDRYAQHLFALSSQFPPTFAAAAGQMGIQLAPGARGFVFNADPVALVHFFEIGTRAALMLR